MGLQYHYTGKCNIFVVMDDYGWYFSVALLCLKARAAFGVTPASQEQFLGLLKKAKSRVFRPNSVMSPSVTLKVLS